MNDERSRRWAWLRARVGAVVGGPSLLVCGLLSGGLASGALACGSGAPAAKPRLPEGVTTEAIEHEDCSTDGHRADALDTNNDGKADITRVYDKSGHELCRIVDLNHDGKPDLYEYFDASGAIRRREFCYDDTGVVNGVERYEGGKLARRELDTTGRHRVDTWDWFDVNAALDPKTGRPAHPLRRERDTSGDGRVDQWWTWDGDKVTIATDRSGTGKPDPTATIVLGGSDDTSGASGASPDAGAGGDSGAATADDAGSAAPTDTATAAAGAADAGAVDASPASTASTAGAAKTTGGRR